MFLHHINRLIINAIVFSRMSNSCVRSDIATLMVMSLLHPRLRVTQWYYESVCHDGWLFLRLLSGYRGRQPITFDLLISQVVSRDSDKGGGEDAAAKCDQSTPCITVDQLILCRKNLNNSLTPKPSGDVFWNWIMKMECGWEHALPGYIHFNIYK